MLMFLLAQASETFPSAYTIKQVLDMPERERNMVESVTVASVMIVLNESDKACFLGRQDKAIKVVRKVAKFIAENKKYKNALKDDYANLAYTVLIDRMPCYKVEGNSY